MKCRVAIGRLTAVVAGLAAAVIAVNAQAAFTAGVPTLTQTGPGCTAVRGGQTCGDLFAGAGVMAPGGPAEVRQAVLTYNGSAPSTATGLYLEHFASRGAASAPVCTAADPASKFDFTVSADGQVLYQGNLASFAAAHSDPSTRLSLPGGSGRLDHWAPGDTVAVTLAVSLDRSADNAYMGCSTDTQFTWFAE
ncbi:MAG TPA: hypothetical protein VNG93_14050 [Candidatus Dormibacteraeota bacterium]|nr:hypothetical protein [Candidatus Dormibacteraeota bacterium]